MKAERDELQEKLKVIENFVTSTKKTDSVILKNIRDYLGMSMSNMMQSNNGVLNSSSNNAKPACNDFDAINEKIAAREALFGKKENQENEQNDQNNNLLIDFFWVPNCLEKLIDEQFPC